MPGGARMPHRKTRTGCIGCKARRIKCDESKPSCRTCTRYQTPCTYAKLSTKNSQGQRLSPLTPQNQDQTLSYRPNTLLSPLTPFNTQHLELLHFYTTTTAYAFSTIPDRAEVWSLIVPQLAFQHPFLLGGILAISALHLSHTSPSRAESLIQAATLYHEPALAEFKVALSIIDRENCDAVYIFSTLLVAYAWATSEGKGNVFFCDEVDEEGGGSGTAEWVSLLRGSRVVMNTVKEWVMSGPVKVFLVPYNGQPLISDLPADAVAKFAALETLWNAQSAFTSTEKSALAESLDKLKEIYAMLLHHGASSSKVDSIGMILAWPLCIPEDYIQLINKRHPEALILLAHYCLLLCKIDHVWFLKGICRRVLGNVCRMVGERWEDWVAWPLKELVLTEFRGHSGGEGKAYGLMREEMRLR